MITTGREVEGSLLFYLRAGCERELLLAKTAIATVADNGMTSNIHIMRKFSTDMTVEDEPGCASSSTDNSSAISSLPDSGHAAATGHEHRAAAADVSRLNITATSDDDHSRTSTVASSGDSLPGAAAGKAPAAPAAVDLPRRADLVVHEIFGTDPLSEQVLPTMRHAQAQLAARGASFMPAGFKVGAAVARWMLLFYCIDVPDSMPKQQLITPDAYTGILTGWVMKAHARGHFE